MSNARIACPAEGVEGFEPSPSLFVWLWGIFGKNLKPSITFIGKMTIARVLDQIPDIGCGARHIMQKLQRDVCHLVGKPKLLIIFYEDSNCEAIFSNNPDRSQSSSDFHEGEFSWQNSTISYRTFSRRRR